MDIIKREKIKLNQWLLKTKNISRKVKRGKTNFVCIG